MNCIYRKKRFHNKYYKVIGCDTVMIIEVESTKATVLIFNKNQYMVTLAIDETATVPVSKEEFDIVLNDAILKMIEISII